MTFRRKQLGQEGEHLAEAFLLKKGYRIIERNYRTPLGELDLIAEQNRVICFIEVKTREDSRYGLPQESITPRKQRKLTKSALVYLKEHHLLEREARFDIVAICPNKEDPHRIYLIQNAFEAVSPYAY